VINKFFVMLVLLIPSKDSIKMHNFDVCMAPLIEELQDLWKGVPTYDVG
jgi:hypothetical protein